MGTAFRPVWLMIVAQFLGFLSSADPTNHVCSLQTHPAELVLDLRQWHPAHISASFHRTLQNEKAEVSTQCPLL